MREFIAEQYLSRRDTTAARYGADAARRAAEQLGSEGVAVQFVRSIFVPDDETSLYIFEADSIESVRLAIARAGLSPEYVAETMGDSGAGRPAK
jgi:hypothetical protein